MELNLLKNAVKISETLLDSKHEQGFESDIILPDYCPDIARILKCSATPKINRCYQNGASIQTDGNVVVCVYYVCGENKIHSYQTSAPFSKTIPISASDENLNIKVTPKIEYVNCRAVNSRRLDIRGAVELLFSLLSLKEKTYPCDCEEKVVKLKTVSAQNAPVLNCVVKGFSVKDEFSLSPDVVKIFRASATAQPTECKVIANKIILKGDMMLTGCTQNSSGEIAPFNHAIPISQILDLPEIDENSVCSTDFDVASFELNHRASENGTIVSVDAKINVYVTVRTQGEVTFCEDAYAISGETSNKCETLTLVELCEHIDTKIIHRHHLQLPEDCASVVDAWCEEMPYTTSLSQNGLEITLPVMVMLIYKTVDGECKFMQVEIEVREKRECGERFEGYMRLCECAFNQNEVSLAIRICGDVLKENKVCAICEINHQDTQKEKPDCALTIYFSQKGEKVWDIAKRYRTASELICLENNIDGDEVGERIIVIPTI